VISQRLRSEPRLQAFFFVLIDIIYLQQKLYQSPIFRFTLF